MRSYRYHKRPTYGILNGNHESRERVRTPETLHDHMNHKTKDTAPSNGMKLVIATGLYPPDIGGPATYTVFLEKHLPRHGIELSVIPFGTVRNVPKLIRHVVYMFKLMHASHGATALYALDTVSVGLPACIASMLTGKPLLLRVPGDYAWEQGQQRFGVHETLDEYLTHKNHVWQVRLLARIQKFVADKARHIVVPSEYIKNVVALWGVPKDKITRIYSVLASTPVPESKSELRKQFAYTDVVVATAGRLVPWKGMRALINVVHGLRKEGMPISLEIMGDGDSRKDLEDRIKELNAAEYVHLRGALDRETLARRIKAADVFVLNTSYEGLSHQLIEVMEIGTPIVTTPVGGNVELIEHEKTGLLVPYNDEGAMHHALRRIHDDTSLREVMVRAAQKELHKFKEDVVIKEFVDLITSLWKS